MFRNDRRIPQELDPFPIESSSCHDWHISIIIDRYLPNSIKIINIFNVIQWLRNKSISPAANFHGSSCNKFKEKKTLIKARGKIFFFLPISAFVSSFFPLIDRHWIFHAIVKKILSYLKSSLRIRVRCCCSVSQVWMQCNARALFFSNTHHIAECMYICERHFGRVNRHFDQ